LLTALIQAPAGRATNSSQSETFEVIAREWLEMCAKTSAAITMQKARWLLEMIFPRVGKRPIREVTAPELLSALRRIESRGHHETAHRAKQKCG